MNNKYILALGLCLGSWVYCNDSNLINLVNIKNCTEYKILLSMHLMNKTIQYRLDKYQNSLWYDKDIKKITIERYGDFLKWTGKTKVLYDDKKERINNLSVLKILVKNGPNWKFDKELISVNTEYPSISSASFFISEYLNDFVKECWDELKDKPGFVKSVLDKMSLDQLRYLQSIPKGASYDSMFDIFLYNAHLIENSLAPDLMRSSKIKFTSLILKCSFIQILNRQFDKYKQSIDIISLKKIVSICLADKVKRFPEYNKYDDKKELLSKLELYLINEISEVVKVNGA